ncbi:MAG TPA: hypothetical protein VGH11_09610 [Jatrophihabitans sp.]|jgi:hypothetical protein
MSMTQDKRFWVFGGAAVAVLVAALSWLFIIGPTMSDTSSLRSQQSEAQLQNSTLTSKINSLKSQNDSIASLRTDLAAAAAALPTTSGLPDFTREITVQAVTTGVGVSNITVGAITPYGTSAAAAAASSNPAGKLYAIPVTITSIGPVKNQFAFLKALQQVGPRQVLVNSTSFSPGAGSKAASIDAYSSLTTVLTVFSAPVTSAQQQQLDKLLIDASNN